MRPASPYRGVVIAWRSLDQVVMFKKVPPRVRRRASLRAPAAADFTFLAIVLTASQSTSPGSRRKKVKSGAEPEHVGEPVTALLGRGIAVAVATHPYIPCL